jgi:hypothetical protein
VSQSVTQKIVPLTVIALRQRQAQASKVAGSADKLKISWSSRLPKNLSGCHPKEPQATKDPCSCLILQLPRFFSRDCGIRMT